MIRRVVCLMLVPALLANQASMCFAHSHQGGETVDHSARSHVHLSASQANCHHHGDSGDHENSDELPVESSNYGLEVYANLPVGHDSDALFFGGHYNLLITFNRISVDSQSVATLFCETEIPRVANSEHRTQVTRAGPFTPYFCAVFLQTRRLLL